MLPISRAPDLHGIQTVQLQWILTTGHDEMEVLALGGLAPLGTSNPLDYDEPPAVEYGVAGTYAASDGHLAHTGGGRCDVDGHAPQDGRHNPAAAIPARHPPLPLLDGKATDRPKVVVRAYAQAYARCSEDASQAVGAAAYNAG